MIRPSILTSHQHTEQGGLRTVRAMGLTIPELAEIAGLREMTIRKKRPRNVSQPSKLVVDIA